MITDSRFRGTMARGGFGNPLFGNAEAGFWDFYHRFGKTHLTCSSTRHARAMDPQPIPTRPPGKEPAAAANERQHGAKTSRKSLLRRVENASKVNFGLHIDLTRRLMLSSLAAFSFIWAASRSVKGTVSDQNGRKLTRAVVYLNDTRSMRIRSFLTRKDGTFEFHGVDANIDYELWARFGKINSATKSLSRFNSEDPVIVDLTIDLA